MSFFSHLGRQDKSKGNTGTFSEEILHSITVMEDRGIEKAPPLARGSISTATPTAIGIPRGESPFLSDPLPPIVEPPVPVPEQAQEKKKFSFPGFIWVLRENIMKNKALPRTLSGAAIIILIGAGAIFWWLWNDEGDTMPEALPPAVTISVAPEVVAPTIQPFAPNAPNYLMIDTETVTSDSLRVLLTEAGTRIQGAKMTEPVEFFLTDKNNNPVAFSRLAYLLKLSLPESLVALMEESFSLYLYNDAGSLRLGLGLMLSDGETVAKELQVIEPSLPFFFQPLLYPERVVARQAQFRSGVYRDFALRFVNVDATQNISLDYSVRSDRFWIGTSKDTLRAILDRNSK